MTDTIMELTTQVEPAKKFSVDGEEFELYGFDHLSDESDAKVTAAFARHDKLSSALARADSDSTARSLAKKLAEKRTEIITTLTSMPVEVAKKLPLGAQSELFKAIREELTSEVDLEAGDEETPDEEE